MDHFLNISPYRVFNQKPFSDLIKIDNDQEITLILYSKFSDNWVSMREINKIIIGKIIEQNLDTIPYLVDVTDKDFESNYRLVLNNCKTVFCLSLTKEVGDFIKSLKKVHSLTCYYLITNSLKSFGYQFKFFGLDAISKSDIFLCLCESDKEILKNLFKENTVKKIDIIDNKMGTKTFKGTKDLVFFGRIHEEKRILEMINLFYAYKIKKGNFSKFKLHLFGEFDYSVKSDSEKENYADRINLLLNTLDDGDRIKFHGYKNRNEIKRFCEETSAIGIFLSTYHNENYGMAVREFLTWNTAPALISNWGAHKDLLDQLKGTNRVFEVKLKKWNSKVILSPFDIVESLCSLEELSPFRMEEASFTATSLKLERPIEKMEQIDKARFLKNISQSAKILSLKFNDFYTKNSEELNTITENLYLDPAIRIDEGAVCLGDKILFTLPSSKEIYKNTINVHMLENGRKIKIPLDQINNLIERNLLYSSC